MDHLMILGFADELDDVARDHLAACDRLFVRGAGPDLARYVALCRVHDASGSGHIRLGGVAIAWSDDAAWLLSQCAVLPDPALVAYYGGPDSGELQATIEGRPGALLVRADPGCYYQLLAWEGRVTPMWQLAPEFEANRLAEPAPVSIAGRARRQRGR